MTAPTDVRLMGFPGEFVAFVTLPNEAEVRVRYARGVHKGAPWKCDTHGTHYDETCEHQTAAFDAYIQIRKEGPPCD